MLPKRGDQSKNAKHSVEEWDETILRERGLADVVCTRVYSCNVIPFLYDVRDRTETEEIV